MHIHIYSGKGGAKFWVEPNVSLAHNYGIPEKEIRDLQKVIGERKDEIKLSWKKHFGN